jgi:hypothetical protein
MTRLGRCSASALTAAACPLRDWRVRRRCASSRDSGHVRGDRTPSCRGVPARCARCYRNRALCRRRPAHLAGQSRRSLPFGPVAPRVTFPSTGPGEQRTLTGLSNTGNGQRSVLQMRQLDRARRPWRVGRERDLLSEGWDRRVLDAEARRQLATPPPSRGWCVASRRDGSATASHPCASEIPSRLSREPRQLSAWA